MKSSKLLRVCTSFSLLLSAALVMPACASNASDEAAKGKDGDAKQKTDLAQQETDPAVEGQPVEGDQKVGVQPGADNAAGANEQYALQIDPGEGIVGEEGKVSIRVVPNTDWHMNLEYPTKLTVTPPAGVEVAKAKLGKDDAVALTEQGCEFAVTFTPSEAGEKTFTGEFKFAVCQDTACVPKTEKLEFQVAVK